MNYENQNLTALMSLVKQTKNDLRIVTSDGTELMGHQLAFGFFSKFLTDLFVSHGMDEDIVTLVVPFTSSELEMVLSAVYGEKTSDKVIRTNLHIFESLAPFH